MSTLYGSHNISSFTPPNWRGKDLHIRQLLRLICLVALLMTVFGSVARRVDPAAQSKAGKTVDSIDIHFRQSQSGLDLSYEGNGERLDSLIRQIKRLSGRDSTFVISALRVIGSASPEGSEKINRLLSEERARSLFDYFAEHITLPDSITDFEYLGRNWRGLYKLAASDRDVPYQTEVLALLRKVLASPSLSAAESNRLLLQLKTLKEGVPYAYMYRHFFPALRYSFLTVEYEKRVHREIGNLMIKTIEADEARADSLRKENIAEAVRAEEITDDTPVEIIGDTDYNPAEKTGRHPGIAETEPKTKKPFYMDLRTNMLFDAVAVPNIGAEFYVGKNFSVLVGWMYGWWDSDRRHRYWRIYGGELAGRWWFGRKANAKPLTGHHLGVYCGALIFDFEWGGTGYMGGKPGATLWDRAIVNTGIEYGYSLPIGKRLNIDFSIGLGYLGGNYIKYFPFDNDYFRQKEYKLRFFGPTKAEISLVWLLGRGNANIRKGGGS